MVMGIFLGAPLFSNDISRLSTIAPISQIQLYRNVWENTEDPMDLFEKLGIEYFAICLSLRQMGISFKVIESPICREKVPFILDRLEAEEFPLKRFPNIDDRVLSYPRDLATKLPNGTLLVNVDLPRPKAHKDRKVIRSPYGEGGRIHQRKKVALVTERYYPENRLSIEGEVAATENMRLSGLKVGLLPMPIRIAVALNRPEEKGFFQPEDHVDRFSGLLESPSGDLHLIVEPNIVTDFRSGPLIFPRLNTEETIERFSQVLEPLDVKLHVPSGIEVSGSVGFWQADDGRVLMTGGDEAVKSLVASIVGEENVFCTPVPIINYPAWNKSSIRCLIGEFPELVADLWA
jgi:hypothetical protein